MDRFFVGISPNCRSGHSDSYYIYDAHKSDIAPIEYDMEDDIEHHMIVLALFKYSNVEYESYFEYPSSYGDNQRDKGFGYVKDRVIVYESFLFTLRVSFFFITKFVGFFFLSELYTTMHT